MVTLVPQLQSSDPEYLRYSKPIGGVEGNKSGYYLSKGLGDALEEGVKTTEKIVGDYAKNKSLEEFTALEERHKADLRPTWEYYKGLDNPNANTQNDNEPLSFLGDPSSSLIQQNKELPPEIKFGTKLAQSNNERFNNGKMSQTQYDMEIDSLAKDLHSRFPAWRNEIDQGMSKATGRSNANQTVTDMLSDINRIQGQLNSQANKLDSHILSGLKDITDSKIRDSILSGHFGKRPGDPGYIDGLTALNHVLRAQSGDTEQKRIETQQHIFEGQDKFDKITVGRNVNSAIAKSIDTWQHSLELQNGVSSWDELMDKVRKVQANPNSVEGQQLANQIASSISELKVNMYKNTRFAARVMGPDLDKNLESASAYFDRLAKDAVGGDVSKLGNIVSSAGNAASAIQQNAKLGWLRIPGFGGALADYEALTSIAPEVSKTYLDTFQSVVKNAGPTIGNHFQETMTKGMSTSPEGTEDNKPLNMNERIEEAHKMRASPQTLQGYMDFINNIKDMPKQQARNLAYTYYGPENIGMVGKWARDGYVSSTGQSTEGQGSVLRKLGDKDVLDKIWSLGDPKLKQHVQSFLEDAVQNRVFPSLMKDLEGTTPFGLAYDNETHQFVIRSITQQIASGKGFPASASSNYAMAKQTVKQLNNIADVVKNLAGHLGKDPNSYMIELLSPNNLSLTKDATGVPAQIESAAVRALANQVLAKKIKEKNKDNQ